MKKILFIFLVLFTSKIFAQDICHADGNVIIFSNYEGGHLTIDIDEDITDLKIGICTYHAADVTFTGTYVANITEVIYAGFDQIADGCGATIDETIFTGVDPSIVTKYDAINGNIAITNYLGDELFGSPIVNCMVGAEGCSETASGGGNASPQIVQFFLAEFGAGSILYSHWTDYSCFPITTFYASEGGNCCFEDAVTPENPIYDEGGITYDFIEEDTIMLCDSLSITFDISFYTVVWGDPEWSTGDVGYTTTVTDPGTYTVSVSDYCHYDPFYLTDTIVVEPCSFTTIIDTSICDGDNYILPDGIIVTDAGTYETILIAVDGTDSIIITNILINPIYSITVDDFLCLGDSYILPDGVLTVSPGTYYSYLITIAGCDSLIITNLTWAYDAAVSVSDSFCVGGNYILPDGTATDTTGIYVVTILTFAGCDSVITLTLSNTILPVVNIDTSICIGEFYTLPDGDITTVSGTYFDTVAITGECDTIYITNLSISPPPLVLFNLPVGVCLNEVYELTAEPPGGIFSGAGVSGNYFYADAAGLGGPYEIIYEYTDANGCTITAVDNISVFQNYIELGPDIYIDQGESTFIDGFTYGISVSWNPTTTMSCDTCIQTNVAPLQTTTYTATSVDIYGCIAVDSITIYVNDDPVDLIFIPNTFTPNGDGLNDYFLAYGPDVIGIKNMRIYDRWGELLFEANDIDITDPESGWDGTARGGYQLTDGVYAYIMIIQLRFGVETTRGGNVMMVR
ncbi:MAG: gliding motility-associated C-terminal domain-containing protein [Fimbriimonadaceae bacterium]|nr:gliding motility-associated C-terminal domain-containing protein [Chitinophagales bacterium]